MPKLKLKKMQKTKRKPGIIAKAKIFIMAMQREIDLSDFDIEEFFADKSDEMAIKVKNGYWQINEKPLIKCSIAKQSLFDQFMRMKLIKLPITQESTFKQRATEIKKDFNYTFKMREQDFLNGFPNLEKLTFEPKN